MQHLSSTKNLTINDINNIIEKTQYFLNASLKHRANLSHLEGHLIGQLFFEPSTRTQHSFEAAAIRLGANTLNPNINNLSIQKGESLLDTVETFIHLGCSALVVRHPDNFILHDLIKKFGQRACFINAGDGSNEHPSQALIDLFTIHQHHHQLENLKITIIGDSLHSRVAHSFLQLINLYKNSIYLYGPSELMMPLDQFPSIQYAKSMEHALKDANVIITLRIQKERFNTTLNYNEVDYFKNYGVGQEQLKFAAPNCCLLHPGPVNYGTELSTDLKQNNNIKITQQIQNGVAIRMTILNQLIKHRSFLVKP